MSDRNRGPAYQTTVCGTPRFARAVCGPWVAVSSLVALVAALPPVLSPDTAGPPTGPSVVGACR